ncbi:MAG: ribonuclease HII [Opitutaceae bacterium]|nr:ribonuclease HII [Opitutaceae bacterium]
MAKRRQLRGFDLKQITGFDTLIGVDEAGRGALAGPVVAGAVRVSRDFLEGRWAQTRASKVNDSKQLTAEVRSEVAAELEKLAADGEIALGVGRAEVGEIESLNILGATKLAMRRALEAIYPPEVFRQREEPDLFAGPAAVAAFQPTVNCRVLIDGLKLRGFPYPHDGLVHGDGRSLCIAMASVAAKVTRDRIMDALGTEYPGYGFAKHKGYGTEEHRLALLRQGRCFQHRDKFVRSFLEGKHHDVVGQMSLFGEEEIVAE